VWGSPEGVAAAFIFSRPGKSTPTLLLVSLPGISSPLQSFTGARVLSSHIPSAGHTVAMSWISVIFVVFIAYSSSRVSANLWCYSCVSSQPGCEEFSVNWFIHRAITCPREDDKCVKIIERRGADVLVTRDCLSNLIGFRKDIPADRYEGCRQSAAQPKVAVYVENNVKELDLKRNYYTDTTYCFCEFDEWCNSANTSKLNVLLVTVSLMLLGFGANLLKF